jgi:hypothetical protein
MEESTTDLDNSRATFVRAAQNEDEGSLGRVHGADVCERQCDFFVL